ncbi:unnamed protein product [Malassezia sympodialis ATCC 42132]|uniref:uncharacterized protein n=1 Tax=Malassezia sympodialis (strain ATCC 42132) TaxID=1230383 RepID=UPI0002C2CDCE|nr:uncharacterized protein MSY001_1303 [Malassezia sympodialis ATCC 42132]CCU98597.1 unnamed protein product [Malassezia sympodialis ATCC 42132]|eukprot:XP_018739895.1 uncharacterized protein MSY001_1303 [Malassezia sympodialis ATCC 42132]
MGCPNVVQILDFDVSFIELNEVYFIFKACDADLSQIIRSDQELTESHIRFFMVQLLRGVHSMHSAHIIHRDLKPGNLLVNTDCRLFICDFGMSRAFESQNSDYLRQHLSLGDNDTNGSIVSTPDDSSQDHFAMNVIDVEADRRDTPHTDKSDQAAFMRFFYSGGADAGSEEKPLPLSKPSQIHFPGAPLTNYVATRWYRAPEVMLRNKGGYTPAMDMWSVGCILAELLGRRPIFPGSDYMDQLSRINKVLGGPSESLLDQMGSAHARHHIESLPHCEGVQWSKLYPGSPEMALDLLNRLLQWDPEKRITAGEALAHPWFKRYWQGSTSTQLPSPFRRFAQVEMIHTPAEFKLAFENQSDTIKDLWMSNPSNFHLETTSSAHFPSPKRPPAVNWQHSSPQSAGTMILDSSTPSSSGPDSVHQDILNGQLHDDEPDKCLSANEPTTSDDGVMSSENFESLKYLMNEVHSMKRSSPPFSNSSSSQDNNHTTSPFPCPNAGTEFDASSDEDGLNLNVNNISSDLNSGALAKAMVDLPGQHVPVSIPPIFPFEVQDILNLDMFSPVLQESLNSIIYPKDVTTKLIDLFFQTLNLQRHPVPKDIIDEAIEDLYKDDTLVTERTLSRFSLLAAVLAISTVFMFVGNAEIRDAMNLDEQYIDLNASRRLYNAAKLACHTLQALGREDVFSVLTYLVLARYTFVTGSPRRSYIHVVHLALEDLR